MKQILFIILIIAILSGLAYSETAPTLRFDRIIDNNNVVESFPGFDETSLGLNYSIPTQTYLLELSENQSLLDIEISITEKERIGSYNKNKIYEDIPTSDDNNLYANVTSSVALEKLASKAVQIYDELNLDNRRYARLIISPVTYEDDGFSYYNKSINIQLDGIPITSDDLIRYDELLSMNNQKQSTSALALDDLTVKYIIISSSDLAASFQRLAEYKSSIGIKCEVRLIENITANQFGRDDAEKLREYLKLFYSEGGEFVLLGGDETKVPIRYAYHNIAYSTPSLKDQQICDLYFADLTGNWDADNDNVFGEKYADSADIIPELKVGRLPFNKITEVENYIDKLIAYERNPGNGDMAYLGKTIFASTDQMRDYPGGGQHRNIAMAYPDYFEVDTVNAVEQSRGDDLNPTNVSAKELEPIISEGYGIVNILAHGSNSSFGVRTSAYNEWPKSYLSTVDMGGVHGQFSNLSPNGNISFYYSLACDNGSFDKDQPPFNQSAPNLAQTLLGLKNAGAVGFVANSRWGWVSSSYILQKRFFDSLFAHPGRPAVEAMYEMKQVYYYHRDQVYGINFLGDPTLIVYTAVPEKMKITAAYDNGGLIIDVSNGYDLLEDCSVILSKSGLILKELTSNKNGRVKFNYDFNLNDDYVISAVKNGFTIAQKDFNPSISTGVDEIESEELPSLYILNQNYPNPFNPSTVISFDLPKSSLVKLSVFNILGQEITTLVNEQLSAGSYQTEWKGNDKNSNQVGSGVYFYRMNANDYTEVKKMVLVR